MVLTALVAPTAPMMKMMVALLWQDTKMLVELVMLSVETIHVMISTYDDGEDDGE